MTRGRPLLADTRCGDYSRAIADYAHGKSFVYGGGFLTLMKPRIECIAVAVSLIHCCRSGSHYFCIPAIQGIVGPSAHPALRI
jgi:hypothetical protein